MAPKHGTLTSVTVRSVVATAVFVVVVGLFGYALQLALNDRLSEPGANVVVTVAVLGATLLLLYVVGRTLSAFERTTSMTRHQKELSYRFTQLLTATGVLVVVVVYVWDVSVANVLLGATVTSVVVALAARQTLSSVLAGIVIMSTDVFRVGDWVRIDDRFGQIQRISFFNTEVLSPQGERHVFPNDDVTARDITNLGRDRYRNDVLVGIDYDTDIDHATAVCDEVLGTLTTDDDAYVDGFHPTTVKDFDASQITLAVKIWVAEPTPQAINQAQTTALSHVKRRFASEGIEIPFPQRTVSDRDPS